MAGTDALEQAIAAACASVGVDLFDLELTASTLAVTIERAGGLDLDEVADVTRMISAYLDEHEELAPSGQYHLEVSTPGLERRLRRPDHFRRAVGETLSLRTTPGTEGERRLEGALVDADDDGITLTVDGEKHRLTYAEIERAKTVFDWQAALRAAPSPEGDGTDDAAQDTTTNAREAQR